MPTGECENTVHGEMFVVYYQIPGSLVEWTVYGYYIDVEVAKEIAADVNGKWLCLGAAHKH